MQRLVLNHAQEIHPQMTWDYGIRWVCKVMQQTTSTAGHLEGHDALKQLTGEMPKILEYLDFSFYDACWYNDNDSLGETNLGRWLGVSHRVGSLMSYWVLTQQGYVISWTTVSRVTNLELQTADVKTRLTDYTSAIKE